MENVMEWKHRSGKSLRLWSVQLSSVWADSTQRIHGAECLSRQGEFSGWGDKNYFLEDRKFHFLSWLRGGDCWVTHEWPPTHRAPTFHTPSPDTFKKNKKKRFIPFLRKINPHGTWNISKAYHEDNYIYLLLLVRQRRLSHTSSQAYPFPQVCGCILFGNAWGSASRKTGVSRPRVTAGQETCQWRECKHWAPVRATHPHLHLLTFCSKTEDAQPEHISLMKRGGGRKWEGRQARPGGTEGGREEGSGERSYLRFHVLLQPPQFADKGCRCQGD